MRRAKFSERDMRSDRLRILGVILARLVLSTIWIWLTGARQRCFDRLTRRSYDAHVKAGDLDLIARLRHRVLCLRVKLRINILEKCVGYSRRLNVGSMIDVLTDGHT